MPPKKKLTEAEKKHLDAVRKAHAEMNANPARPGTRARKTKGDVAKQYQELDKTRNKRRRKTVPPPKKKDSESSTSSRDMQFPSVSTSESSDADSHPTWINFMAYGDLDEVKSLWVFTITIFAHPTLRRRLLISGDVTAALAQKARNPDSIYDAGVKEFVNLIAPTIERLLLGIDKTGSDHRENAYTIISDYLDEVRDVWVRSGGTAINKDKYMVISREMVKKFHAVLDHLESKQSQPPPPARGRGTPPPTRGRGTPPPARGRGTPTPARGRGTPTPARGRGTPPPARGRGTSIKDTPKEGCTDADKGIHDWERLGEARDQINEIATAYGATDKADGLERAIIVQNWNLVGLTKDKEGRKVRVEHQPATNKFRYIREKVCCEKRQVSKSHPFVKDAVGNMRKKSLYSKKTFLEAQENEDLPYFKKAIGI
jgi:hypothetical protein